MTKPAATDKEVVEDLKLTYENILRKYGVPRLQSPANDKWLGPCGDSFCYASCDLPDCHWELRMGNTPNQDREVRLAVARNKDPNIAELERLIDRGSTHGRR